MTALVRATSLAGYERLAQQLGMDATQALRNAGLALRCLHDPDAFISYAAMMRLLENSARHTACSDFGLRLSQTQSIDVLGPLAVLMRHACTLGEALQLASRYIFVHSPVIRFDISPVQGEAHLADLGFEIDMPQRPPCTQTIELSLGLIVQVLRLLVPSGLGQVSVRFPHSRCASLDAYRQALACPCSFDADRAAVRISAAVLAQPLSQHNQWLQAMARDYLDRNFSAPEQLLSSRVRELVRRFLGTGQLTQAMIADGLAIHPRTLQRRLAQEGTTFAQIVDVLRRDLLAELLSSAKPPPLAHIALLLGYSEQAALTRSCRRWFGCPPAKWRRLTLLEKAEPPRTVEPIEEAE